MVFGKRIKNNVELERAKELFFRHGGNLKSMAEDDSAYDEYKKLKISREMQKMWLEELFDTLLSEMLNKPSVYDRIASIGVLSNFGIKTECLFSTIVDMFNESMDTFTRLLLCEYLKKLMPEIKKNLPASDVVEQQKAKMLTEPISIDARYLELAHMKSYNFSDLNIKKRIELL